MQENYTVRPRYYDRTRAGMELAADLRTFLQGYDPVILAIPRGGIPVAAAIAGDLSAQLDILIPRRIYAPDHPDRTLGAITPDRTLVVNRALMEEAQMGDDELDSLSTPVWAEAQNAQQIYRKGRPYPDLRGRTAVIVDDRLTTGYTMMAAVMSARKLEPSRIVVAVPVSYIEGIERVRSFVDELVSLEITTDQEHMLARFYATYTPVTDREVSWTLERFWQERPPSGYAELF